MHDHADPPPSDGRAQDGLPDGGASTGPTPPGDALAVGGTPALQNSPSVVFLTVVSAISLAADLVTKAWAKGRLQGFDPATKSLKKLEVVEGHLDFIFAQNPGGAWSFLRSLPDTLRRPFFLVVSVAAIVFIVSIYRRILPEQRAMRWGLPLALGGAMGNLVDRVRYGWVIDFVDVYVTRGGRELHWPTFNVADVAIVVGVGLMALDMLFTRGPKAKASDLKSDEPTPAVPPPA